MNIYIGNLPYKTSDDELRELFEHHGQVSAANVIYDRRTRRSRGYGFVEMPDDGAARQAIDALNGSEYGERTLKVAEANPRDESRPRRDSRPAGRKQAAPAEKTSGGLFGFVKKLFG